MTYELAKELKDAGFWEQSFLSNRDWGRSDFAWLPSTEITKQEREKLWIPTLSELISALGKDFDALFSNYSSLTDQQGEERWRADATDRTGYSVIGRSPEEALARLWLTLRKNGA